MSEGKNYPVVTVSVYIFNDKGQLLLVKTPDWKKKWVAPGGHIEFGERAADAAKREVKEELGLDIDSIESVGFIERTDLNGEYSGKARHMVVFQYKSYCLPGSDIVVNEEVLEYAWHRPETWLKLDVHPLIKPIIEGFYNQEDWEHKYKRALADYQNLLKRTAQEKEEFYKFAHEGFIMEILPVYDNLKVSLQHIDESAKTNGWAEGIKHVVKQFKDVLSGLGVEEIEVVGKEFDHHTMEALEGSGNRVIKVIKPGYVLKGKVIVPAKVVLDE